METWIVVDGYNVIGMSRKDGKKRNSLEQEREDLIRDLSEYQALTGKKVFLVFDAHLQPDIQVSMIKEQITLFYTKKGETADEMIERFVREHKNQQRQIYVVTSDHMEQRIVFGQGALRISSRELLEEMQVLKQKMLNKEKKHVKQTLFDLLSNEAQQKLEKWRRKK